MNPKRFPILLLLLTTPLFSQTYTISPEGDDSNTGQQSAPFKTISHAIKQSKPGDTILLTPGIYREALYFTHSGAKDQPITVTAEKPNTVIIDGADPLTGWTHDPESKPIYSTPWDHDFFFSENIRTHFGPKSDGATTAVGYAEQFIAVQPDGQEQILKQVLHPHELAENTFAIDYDNHKVSIYLQGGIDPSTITILGSTKKTLATPQADAGSEVPARPGSYITLKNLTFRHAANFAQRQAVRTTDGWQIQDCTVEKCNAGGIGVSGTNVHLLRVTSQDNGQLGLGGSKATDAIIENCISQRNNYKGFSPGNEAGGGKFTATTGLQILNCSYRDNNGIGLWLDFKNKNFKIDGGSYTGNHCPDPKYMGAGIMTEICDGPGLIQNATFSDNSGPAVEVAETMKLTVQRNNFIHNYIDIRDMPKRDPYHIADLVITNNHFKDTFISTSIGQWPPEAAAAKKITIDHNTYENPRDKPLLYWGTLRAINSLEEARQKLNIEPHGTSKTN